MSAPVPMQHEASNSPPNAGFFARLRVAGVEPGDGIELRLNKSLLVLMTGLIAFVMMLWVAIYHLFGLRLSADLPLIFQGVLVANMLIYVKIRNFNYFRLSQIGLLLFLPFVAQWIAGNFVVSSGVVLWGVLAPVAAILCFGARESIGWFIAWMVLTILSAAADYYLADPMFLQESIVPIRVSLVFFALNFVAVASITYSLLLFAIEQRRTLQRNLDESREQLAIAQSAAENIFFRPML